jgi:hypothetical protein
VLRAVLAGFACAALVTLVGTDGSISERAALVREAATIVPPGTRIVQGEYRSRCSSGPLVVRTAPCVSFYFRLPGSAAERAHAILDRAGDRWRVARRVGYYGWDLRLGRSKVHARADVLSPASVRSCRDAQRVISRSCDDYLLVEAGADVITPLHFIPPAASGFDAVDARDYRVALLKKKP